MNKVVCLLILALLFALSFPTLLSIGEIIAESEYAVAFIQVVLVIIAIFFVAAVGYIKKGNN